MTDEQNRNALEDRLATVLKRIESCEPGSKEHAALAAEIEMLVRALNEQQKLDFESTKATYEALKDDKETKERGWDRFARAVTTVVEVTVPAVLGFLGLKLALGFESEGTFRSKSAYDAVRKVTNGRKL